MLDVAGRQFEMEAIDHVGIEWLGSPLVRILREYLDGSHSERDSTVDALIDPSCH
jgi:hypothetical protein